jgi:pilus assembly protein FimV
MAIRPDTDPKSASPRSGAPKGELEQYGVWVKAEPQDIAEEVTPPSSAASDFDLSAGKTTLTEESFLSEDEEKLLGSFDADFESGSASGADDTGPLPDIEDMPPLEGSLLEPAPLVEEVQNMPEALTETSLSDYSSIRPDAELDMDKIEGLDAPSSLDIVPHDIEDISSDSFGKADGIVDAPKHSDTSSEAEFGADLADVTSEFLDADEALSENAPKDSSADFEPLDIDLHFDDEAAKPLPQAPSAKNEQGLEDVTEFDDFLSSESKEKGSIDEGFDDVSAVERELSAPEAEESSPLGRRGAPSASSAPASSDLSTEILMKIADELSSIRGELISLKSKIGDVMSSVEAAPSKAAVEAPASEASDESAPMGGFFDEEEDETIALTGDELDNILNTADFTEEVAEAETPLDLDVNSIIPEPPSPESAGLLEESLLPETGEYLVESEPAIEEVRIGQPDSIDDVPVEAPSADVLDLVADEGITPMTSAPEDTSYLEAEAQEEAAIVDRPPADEPLVEPDLSELDLEAEDLEPRLEVDEELPLASPEPPVEDITLGMEAGPDYKAAGEGILEAEFLEPIPEIEEPNFAEINLHEEELEPLPASDISEVSDVESLPATDFSSLEPSPALVEEMPFEEESDLVLMAEGDNPFAEKTSSPEIVEPFANTAPSAPQVTPAAKALPPKETEDGERLKSEIRSVLSYLDKLLDSLPEAKIEEFARSEYFDTYKKLFEELGLV